MGGSWPFLLALLCTLRQETCGFRVGINPPQWLYDVPPPDLEKERTCTRLVSTPTSGECAYLSQVNCDGSPNGLGDLPAGHQRCLRQKEVCAVVGSSGNLLGSSYGELIDSMDAVIRVNGAPSGLQKAKYARDVGKKTTTRFINTIGGRVDSERTQEMCIFLHEPAMPCEGILCFRNPYACSGCRLAELRCSPFGSDSASSGPGNVVFLSHIEGAVAERLTSNPTSGFHAFLHAINHCSEVHIFGFGPACDINGIGRDYYHPGAPDKSHNYTVEFELMQTAAAHGARAMLPADLQFYATAQSVTLHIPDCTIEDQDPRAAAFSAYRRARAKRRTPTTTPDPGWLVGP